jgi:hypothetical protein
MILTGATWYPRSISEPLASVALMQQLAKIPTLRRELAKPMSAEF